MRQATTKNGPNGDLTLFFGQTQSICPFVPAIPMQGNMGQVQLVRMPCTDSCPLVEVADNTWTCHCGKGAIHKLAEEIQQAEVVPTGESKIIRLGEK